MPPDPAMVRDAARKAGWYRRQGYQPLPSDPRPASEGGRKKPLCRFREFWTDRAPDDLFDVFPTTNIQVMTGRYWNLAVLDLDGAGGVAHVRANWRPLPETWTVTSGGGGEHLWFSLPPNCPPRGRDRLWGVWEPSAADGKGDWKEHTGVELLVDRSLIMAPPSIHPKTGRAYAFAPGLSPREIPRPAELPAWVWAMPAIDPPVPPPRRVVAPYVPPPARTGGRDRPSWDAVVKAVRDKAGLARTWGLRFADRAEPNGGWVSVHDFNRPDSNPSARFNAETGEFWRPGNPKMNFLGLAEAIGAYPTWKHAADDMAARYLP